MIIPDHPLRGGPTKSEFDRWTKEQQDAWYKWLNQSPLPPQDELERIFKSLGI
jgi:hypothetical protein